MHWENQYEGKSMNYDIMKCTSIDEQYPKALKDISKKPSCIYYIGDINILNQGKSIAIVGSRNCSEQARRLAVYASHLFNGATGNQILENQRKAEVINDSHSLEDFMVQLPDVDLNRQLSLFDM